MLGVNLIQTLADDVFLNSIGVGELFGFLDLGEHHTSFVRCAAKTLLTWDTHPDSGSPPSEYHLFPRMSLKFARCQKIREHSGQKACVWGIL